MSFPQPNRRFSTARDLQQMATMLDDYMLLLTKDIGLKYDFAFLPRQSRCNTQLKVGTMVVAGSHNTIQRAGTSSADVLMNGVVIDVLGNDNYVWANTAQMEIPIADATGQFNQPIYLGTSGLAQVAMPVEGWVQQVGLILSFNGQTERYLCAIEPGIPMFVEVIP